MHIGTVVVSASDEDGGMARVPYPDPSTLAPETSEFLAKLPPLNIFRMLAGGEGLLRAFVRFGNHLLYKTELDPVLREIAIVRVGVLSNASYEVHQHEAISRSIGMSDELIAAIRGGDDPVFDELQRLVVRYTDEVVADVRPSDATFDALAERLSLQELQELTITIGFYMAVSRYLETFGVDIEDSAPPLDVTRS
jgi:alkylhydroperoxidase family enzyme